MKKTKKKTKKKIINAFTLIELLAVIIILGILMLVAIPSVTRYISDSRRETYIETARQYVKGAVNLVNDGQLDMYDTNTTYYIPSSCIKLESGGQSPYGGKFNPAYIVVTYNNDSYNYYWMSTDNQGMGIKVPTLDGKLNIESVETGVKAGDITPTIGIDGRGTIVEFSGDCKTKEVEKDATGIVPGAETTSNNSITYPSGKDKDSLAIGDIVTIGTEQFNVIKTDSNNIYLLARYNLTVGNKIHFYNGRSDILGAHTASEETYGKQNSGNIGVYGTANSNEYVNGSIIFSTTNYWHDSSTNKPKSKYGGSYSRPNFPYIYDSNSNLYKYVVNYAKLLGVPVKEARLMTYNEAVELGCQPTGSRKCENYPFLTQTTFYLGNAVDSEHIWSIYRTHHFSWTIGPQPPYTIEGMGLRPVIVIAK